MTKKIDSCLRCNLTITCNADNIEQCACTEVNVSKETLEHLQKTNYTCLCNNCLVEIDKLVNLSLVLPTKATEGLHYIMENGLLVFTELNHIQRGYCCGSNCRNCAYGYRLKNQ